MRTLLLASACLVPACATTAGTVAPEDVTIDPIAAIDRDAELAQLRRENDRLRREMRKMRALGAASDSGSATRPAQTRRDPARPRPTTSDYSHLPVVKVGPGEPNPVPVAPTAAPSTAIALGEVPHSGVSERGLGQTVDERVYPERDHLPALAPEPEDSTASYQLVGSELVRASKRERTPVPDRKIEIKGKAKTSAKSKSKRSRGDQVLAAYKDAMTLYKAGEMVAAERAFAAIVGQNASHEYADNALYWQGEAAYDQKHYDAALNAFTGVIERYGGGNKAPDALLKIGLCYGKLGDLANSRDVLSQLVSAYPSARATKIAQSRLAELPEG